MTSWQSLLYCAVAEVTIERIRNLIAVTGTEPITVEFKGGAGTVTIPECAAAMANTHGGVIFLGITDQDREITGVPREAIAHVADALAVNLVSPDWQPEMFEVPVPDAAPERYVVVIRVNAETAPRPVFVQGKKQAPSWAPVRGPGTTRQATREELRSLFAEDRAAMVATAPWVVRRPDLPRDSLGDEDSRVDFILGSGLQVPAGPSVWGRPLSERAVDRLAHILDGSALARALFPLSSLTETDTYRFRREGRVNRSDVASLVWRLRASDHTLFEIAVRIGVPSSYAQTHDNLVTLTIELTSRLTAALWLEDDPRTQWPPKMRSHFSVDDWSSLLDAVVETLSSDDLTASVADLAGADRLTIRQPGAVHIVSVPPISQLLPRLRPIPGAGGGRGAHLLADPALDLRSPVERAEQVDRWLMQMALDAGVVGMEQLVAVARSQTRH